MSDPIMLDNTSAASDGPPPTDSLHIRRAADRTWQLRASQSVPFPRERIFPFFADAGNLARLTPPTMGFEIVTPMPIAMREGTLIDYRIRVFGVRLRWRTLISRWDPPNEFVDEQLRGPYAVWTHRHRFTDLPDGGTLIEDDVRFRLPFGPLGALGAPIVRRQLRAIFRYRRDAISGLVVAM